jgi:hypothetical protein
MCKAPPFSRRDIEDARAEHNHVDSATLDRIGKLTAGAKKHMIDLLRIETGKRAVP